MCHEAKGEEARRGKVWRASRAVIDRGLADQTMVGVPRIGNATLNLDRPVTDKL